MNLIKKILQKHNLGARETRTTKLAKDIAVLLSDSKSFLDVGAFDGLLTKKIMKRRKGLKGKGVDILIPEKTFINVKKYDGKKIPYANNSFDATLLIDVLHHAEVPVALLKEACRVSKKHVIIKDHYYTNFFGRLILSIIDFLGNESFNIKVKFHFYRIEEWGKIFKQCNLKIINKNFRYKQKKRDLINHILVKLKKQNMCSVKVIQDEE